MMMRSSCKLSRIVFATAAYLAIVPAFADEPTLPKRAAGLWELKTTMNEGNGPRESSLSLCIDTQMENNTVAASMNEHRNNCERYVIEERDGGTVVDAKCKFTGREVTSHTVMSGDFTSSFKVNIESTTTDSKPNDAQTVVVKRTIIQEGTYVSADCGKLEPGHAMAPDGTPVAVQ